MIGQTISHYRVIVKIGQGGMGVVYRAQDTNLSREMAIKVLPEQFTQDPQRLARFEREAKLLASLNHPNIAAIYSLEACRRIAASQTGPSCAAGLGDTCGPREEMFPPSGVPLEHGHTLNFRFFDRFCKRRSSRR